MVNLLKYKHKLCKKYEEDIWGFVVSSGKFTRLGELLSTDQVTNARVSRTDLFNNLLRDRKKVCLFYGGLKVYEFKRYCAEAKRISKGNFSDTVVALLERRLDVFLYRINFVNSVAEGAALVKAGYFTVNREECRTPYKLLQKGDLVELRPEYRERIKSNLLKRLENNFYPVMYPKYTEANYQIMAGILLYYPVMSEVYYPFNVDEDFYYLSYFSRFA